MEKPAFSSDWATPDAERVSHRRSGNIMRRLIDLIFLLGLCAAPGCAQRDGRRVLFADEFTDPALPNWFVELEKGGTVAARDGALDIDVPGGCTVWFKRLIEGPVVIEYEVTAISAGGANDRVSDLNCFWMARDARSRADLFATKRAGRSRSTTSCAATT
jgi:hypothetical protein